MTTDYTVGMKDDGRTRIVVVEAEDALIAALKAKHASPRATINYVRRCNRRGDRRHPHERIAFDA